MTSILEPGISQPATLCRLCPEPVLSRGSCQMCALVQRPSPCQAFHQQPCPDVKLRVGELQTQTNKSARPQVEPFPRRPGESGQGWELRASCPSVAPLGLRAQGYDNRQQKGCSNPG